LNTKLLWGEDELGTVPVGEIVQVYIIVFKTGAILLKAVLQQQNGAAPEFLTTKNIGAEELKYFKLESRIFPYD